MMGRRPAVRTLPVLAFIFAGLSALFLFSQNLLISFGMPKSTAESAAEKAIPLLLPSLPVKSEPKYKSSPVLPPWMKEYLEWHQQQRKLLTPENWASQKFFVQRCLKMDNQCGGTSDRLQSIPAKLRMAAQFQRILLILWERPHKLEEFLVPPAPVEEGLDWSVPEWLHEKLSPLFNETCFVPYLKEWVIERALQANQTMIDTRSALGSDFGAGWYDKHLQRNEASFKQVYHELWPLLFQPSPPVRNLIQQQMQNLTLTPGHYDALHIRTQFLSYDADNRALIENATNCALFSHHHHHKPLDSSSSSLPLYVATDSNLATTKAVQYASQYNRHVVARAAADNNAPPPLHLDRGFSFFRRKNQDVTDHPEFYYDTFVDLYLLSQARCLTYGRGGYGKWANLMRANYSCYTSYFGYGRYKFPPECQPPNSTKKEIPSSSALITMTDPQ